jgi:hypothetical protein
MTHVVDISTLSIEQAWRDAENRAMRERDLRAVPVPAGREGVRASVSFQGYRGLLVPLQKGEPMAVQPALDPQGTGVIAAEVAEMHLSNAVSDGGVGPRFLHVWCRDHGADDAFAAFCELFCDRLGTSQASKALQDCCDEFRRLLADADVGGLGGVVGLVGELLLLEDLMKADPSSIRSWVGPGGGRHDFRNGAMAFEVKSNQRSEVSGRKIRITSIDQLDAPPQGRLYLHAVRLEEVKNGTVTVDALRERVEDLLRVHDLEFFHDRIGPARAKLASRHAFEVLARTTYEVTVDFPRLSADRLISGTLDSGVSGVSYEIDLGAVPHLVVATDAAIAAFLSGGRGG